MKKELEIVYNYQKEIKLLSHIDGLLGWDQLTYMPTYGVEARSEQMSYVSSLIHKKFISDELFRALTNIKKTTLSKKERIMVRKLFKEAIKARKLPESFVHELAKTTSIA